MEIPLPSNTGINPADDNKIIHLRVHISRLSLSDGDNITDKLDSIESMHEFCREHGIHIPKYDDGEGYDDVNEMKEYIHSIITNCKKWYGKLLF